MTLTATTTASIQQVEAGSPAYQHIQDFWGEPFTAAGVQSGDAKGAYVMLNLAGDQGTTLANQSVDAVRKVVGSTPAPPGVKAYVTGPAALTDDLHVIGNASLAKITVFTLGAIAIMLLIVYRSVVTTLIQLFLTGIGLASSRGVVAVLGIHNVFGLTTFVIESPDDAGNRGGHRLRDIPVRPLSRGASGR